MTSSHRAPHAHNETLGEICLTLRCAAYDMSPSCGDDLPGPYCSFCCSLSTRVFTIHIVFGIHARMFLSFANGLPFTQNVVSKRKTRRIFFFKHRLILTSKFYSCHFVCIDQNPGSICVDNIVYNFMSGALVKLSGNGNCKMSAHCVDWGNCVYIVYGVICRKGFGG